MITPETCAVLCEPIQGESGVRPLTREYLQSIRDLCDRHDLLLIFDEVQTGMGRTGTLFAYEQCGITPDIMTLAKALGNGMPIGAMLTTEKIGAVFTPGTHASTFGGNPVAAAAGVATVKTMLAEGFLAEVRAKGEYFAARLNDLAKRHPQLATGARGVGLLQGLVLTDQGIKLGMTIVQKLFQRGMLINFAGNAVLRFIPPLIVTREEIDTVVAALDKAFSELS
jgi:acetylornithine aminotransferase/acetylornithine/N-succinyldiaminopimelate aminotransferase